MTHADDRDEVDRKFAEMVSAEFGREVGTLRPDLIEDDLAAQQRSTPTSSGDPRVGTGASHNSTDEIDDLWFNDDVDYRNQSMPPVHWRPGAVTGLALLVAATVVGVVNLLGVVNLGALRWVSVALLVAGVSVLLGMALRRNPDPDDQPGARL